MDKFQEIINGEGLTLVDFFATWCGPCKMMSPILEEFKTKIGDKATVIKIDVDKNEALSLHYRIQSVPTLMLFKKGEVVWRHSGVISADHLVKLIGQHQ
ncbi:MAG: thioredoxin [Bacteroidales bacterium]